MGIEVVCVPPAMIRPTWAVVAAMIDAGYAAADEPLPADLIDWLQAGKGLLWVAVDDEGRIVTAMVTSLVTKRSGLACRMVACGGEAPGTWASALPVIEQYARAEGCKKVYTDGRRGWERVLASSGYVVTGVALEKGL